MFGYTREAIRVKVKKCEGALPSEFRKFSVDPQITSFEVLQNILDKAFDLKGDYAICYRIVDSYGSEIYMPLLSDWDLDAAFLKAHNISLITKSEPCLCLRVDLKPFEECTDEWEIKQPIAAYSPAKPLIPLQEIKHPPPRLHGIFNHVGKTINLMQRAFNFGEDGGNNIVSQYPPKAPLSDAEFRRYLDPVGQIINAKELRSCIYFGGIEPSLRKVVWKHLLNVYPKGMTGKQRMDYIKKKALEYYTLKEVWKSAIAQGPVDGELAYTTGMVKKDVLRTDRHHEFYAGNDDNQNIASLFNILTTYALNHPKVSYCQGMSDLASPLLVTMNDEAHAYICFCALMERLCTNFMIDGIAMTQKFSHLSEAIMYYDPEFYNYLKLHQADDLLFCYRWLLLEMKREFAFEDSLRMLEVLWSSLPADPPEIELKLVDVKFQLIPLSTPPISPLVKTPRENAYTKVCALRRRSSSISLNNFTNKKKLDKAKRLNHSLDEMVIKSKTINEIKLKQQSLDDTALAARQKEASAKTPKSPKSLNSYETNTVLDEGLKPNSEAPTSHLTKPELRPRSVSPSEQNKSDSSVVIHNQINNHKTVTKVRSSSLSSSMTNLIKSNKKGKHFKELKEKIVSSKIFSSLDQLDSGITKEETENKPAGKMIKNLNEFLNFASVNKNKISDKILKLGSIDIENPKVTLTKSSLDDSETSSMEQNSSNFSKSRCVSTTSCSGDDTFDDYSPDDQEYFPLTTSVTRELRMEMDNLDRQVLGTDHFNERLGESPTCKDGENCEIEDKDEVDHQVVVSNKLEDLSGIKKCDDIFFWENPLHQSSPNSQKPPLHENSDLPLGLNSEMPSIVNEISASKTVTPIRIINYCTQPSADLPQTKSVYTESTIEVPPAEPAQHLTIDNIIKFNGSDMTNSCEEVTESSKNSVLPPPDEFGGGNPFLMFLCITVLLQHRDHIIEKGMDYNEMAMHFDKMIRRHNVVSVLNQARQMYGSYMKQQSLLLRNHKT